MLINPYIFQVSVPETGAFYAVSYNNATYRIQHSTDGTSWTGVVAPTGNWFRVAYSPELNQLCSIEFNTNTLDKFMTSTDGTTWTLRSGPAGINTKALYDIVWANSLGLWVTTTTSFAGKSYTSPDGITWTERTIQAEDWFSLSWSETLGVLVCVGTNSGASAGRISTSTDGITWTARTAPGGALGGSEWCESISKFIICGFLGNSTGGAYSTDGTTWTAFTYPSNGDKYDVSWSDDLGIGITVGGDATNRARTFSSTNGTTWTLRSNPLDATASTLLIRAAWSPEYGHFSTVGFADTMYSTNGTSWTTAAAADTSGLWFGECWATNIAP